MAKPTKADLQRELNELHASNRRANTANQAKLKAAEEDKSRAIRHWDEAQDTIKRLKTQMLAMEKELSRREGIIETLNKPEGAPMPVHIKEVSMNNMHHTEAMYGYPNSVSMSYTEAEDNGWVNR